MDANCRLGGEGDGDGPLVKALVDCASISRCSAMLATSYYPQRRAFSKRFGDVSS